jgi:hypothetical protein
MVKNYWQTTFCCNVAIWEMPVASCWIDNDTMKRVSVLIVTAGSVVVSSLQPPSQEWIYWGRQR